MSANGEYDPESVLETIKQLELEIGADDYRETALRIRRAPDPDSREATKIAVDTSKTFITISIAAFAIIGLFARYYLSQGLELHSAKMIALGASAALALGSTIFGFTCLSTVYKIADGIERNKGQPMWGVSSIREKLNRQAQLGLGSILSFATAIIFWNQPLPAVPGAHVSFTPVDEGAATTWEPPVVLSVSLEEVEINTAAGTESVSFPLNDSATTRFTIELVKPE